MEKNSIIESHKALSSENVTVLECSVNTSQVIKVIISLPAALGSNSNLTNVIAKKNSKASECIIGNKFGKDSRNNYSILLVWASFLPRVVAI